MKLFNKANTFYLKKRYVDAFEHICQAIILVKQELAESKLIQKKKNYKLKKSLALDDNNVKITKQLASKIKLNRSVEIGDLKKQSVYLYAQKSHLVDHGSSSVNEFTNHQITTLYKNIELCLMKTQHDIQRLDAKLE